MKVLRFLLLLALCAHAAAPIQFHTAAAGFVSLNIYRPNGVLARQLLAGAPLPAGDHKVAWDGLSGGKPLPPADYTWRAIFNAGLALKVRGWIGDFGGDRGGPSGAAADDTQIYLGWSVAGANADTVVACDPSGMVRWTHRRGALSGCSALGVDAGTVFVLGGEGPDAQGRAIYRLSTRDGTVIPWPDGRVDLKIGSLWPAKGNYKPDRADCLAVKNGRIYLSFTAGQFIAILDARTGAYLQTIVGAPPGAVAAVGTKSESPDNPDQLIDSDFVVLALAGGALGKLLLAHDPIWVLGSELTSLDPGQRITALTMLGDGAKHRARDIFIALGSPANQIQARSALDTETIDYTAGKAGGRNPGDTWDPGRLGGIRGVALDATGQLWVAEGDAVPGRISVWTTDSPRGRLAHQFFAPPDPTSPIAVDPLDPRLIVAAGCEWRIDPVTGRAACIGVITRDPLRAVRFVMERDHVLLGLTPAAGREIVLERDGDGDYVPHPGSAPEAIPPKLKLLATTSGSGAWRLATADGYDLGIIFNPAASRGEIRPALDASPPLVPALTDPILWPMADGRVFITARRSRIWDLELTGLQTLRPLASGTVTLP